MSTLSQEVFMGRLVVGRWCLGEENRRCRRLSWWLAGYLTHIWLATSDIWKLPWWAIYLSNNIWYLKTTSMRHIFDSQQLIFENYHDEPPFWHTFESHHLIFENSKPRWGIYLTHKIWFNIWHANIFLWSAWPTHLSFATGLCGPNRQKKSQTGDQI